MDEEWDRRVSSFILESAIRGGKNKKSSNADGDEAYEIWSLKKLRAYIQWARHSFMPELSYEAQCILKAYYGKQRRSDGMGMRDAARTTIRLLESLVRLTQAHARLMARDTADISDAVTAVLMVEASNNTLNVISNENTLHADFSEDPDEAQKQQNLRVLHALNLVHLLRKGDDDNDGDNSARDRPTSQWNFGNENNRSNDNIIIASSPSPQQQKPELALFSSRSHSAAFSHNKRRRVDE